MKLKKTLSLVLALVLAFSGLCGLTASAKEISYTKNCPVVYVIGFMSDELYRNPGTDEQEVIWPPSTESILSAVKSVIPSLLEVSLTKDWDKFTDAVIPAANSILAPACLNKSGEVDNNTGIIFEYPTEEEVKAGDEFSFHYDWRLSPLEIAKELNDFIEYICRVSGSEKVCLRAHSYGGVITLSYIELFGRNRVSGVVLDSTAIFGETYTGELLNGQIVLSTDAITSFLEFAFSGSDYECLLNAVIDLLEKAGVLDFVLDFADEMVAGIRDRAIPEVVMPLFCCWPTIWAMCPDEYLQSAYHYVFDEVCGSNKSDYSKLIEKLEAFDKTVRADKVSLLTETEKECRFGVFSAYGYSSIPITPSWYSLGDGVIDTKYTSFGATTATYNATLDKDYLAGRDEKYISPDKVIDASTCLFPEKTWFIHSMKHSGGRKALSELMNAILFGDEEVTVDTYEAFPRFLEFDSESETVKPAQQDTLLSKLVSAIKLIVEYFKKLLSGMLG